MSQKRNLYGIGAAALVLAATGYQFGFSSDAVSAQQEAPFRNPSVTHLMRTYSLTEAEAQKRIDLQSDIMALAESLNSGNDPDFGGIYVQQQPVFRIVVSFADRDDRKAFVDSISPRIRQYVQIRPAKRSKGQVISDQKLLDRAFAEFSEPFVGGYNLETERFEYIVGSEGVAERFRATVPERLKSDLTVSIGALPGNESAPTGVQSGDTIRGGQTAYFSSLSPACTFSYAVTYTKDGVAKRGILTAGHCSNTLVHKLATHNVTLSGPDYDKETCGVGGQHDYQIMETTGMGTSYTIEYKDKNSIPEFPASGTLDLTGTRSVANSYGGMVVCKSGQTTGITCGEITSTNTTFREINSSCPSGTASGGYIRVSKSNQTDLSAGGDSGGPWFVYPGTSQNILGTGLHTAGGCVYDSAGKCQSDTGPTAYSIYMPIERINDHNSTVSTIKKP